MVRSVIWRSVIDHMSVSCLYCLKFSLIIIKSLKGSVCRFCPYPFRTTLVPETGAIYSKLYILGAKPGWRCFVAAFLLFVTTQEY